MSTTRPSFASAAKDDKSRGQKRIRKPGPCPDVLLVDSSADENKQPPTFISHLLTQTPFQGTPWPLSRTYAQALLFYQDEAVLRHVQECMREAVLAHKPTCSVLTLHLPNPQAIGRVEARPVLTLNRQRHVPGSRTESEKDNVHMAIWALVADAPNVRAVFAAWLTHRLGPLHVTFVDETPGGLVTEIVLSWHQAIMFETA